MLVVSDCCAFLAYVCRPGQTKGLLAGVAGASGFDFFFQAGDGIRVGTVTGVQTCALPICVPWRADPAPYPPGTATHVSRTVGGCHLHPRRVELPDAAVLGELVQLDPDGPVDAGRFRDLRSEERRVGKECRARSYPYPEQRQ